MTNPVSDNLQTEVAIVPRPVTESLWFNAIWFQCLWFSVVLGRHTLLPLSVALLLAHIWLCNDKHRELRQMLLIGGMGMSVDALLSVAGVFVFAGNVLIPLWLCCLWLGFSAVLGRSLAWLAVRPLGAALAGAIAFPLNYWAGQRLGAVEFGYSLPITFAILAASWAILLPLMYTVTAYLQKPAAEEN